MGTKSDEYPTQSELEIIHNFNALVAWLHSRRWKNIIRVFDELTRTVQGRPIKVLDVGCAHAQLFDVLNGGFHIDYTGIELRKDLAKIAKERYERYPNFHIFVGDATNRELLEKMREFDVVVAVETLEHIPERDVVRLVEHISKIGPRFFVCSVPVEIGPAIWLKNVGSLLVGYPRHKEYTWLETFWAGLYRLDKLPAHTTDHKGFDWRWLAQTIRHNMKIRKFKTDPFNLLPAALSTSVFIVAEPKADRLG